MEWITRPRRLNDVRSDNNHELGLVRLEAIAPEKLAEDGDIHEPWNSIDSSVRSVLEQTCDRKTLPVLQLYGRVRTTRGEGRNEDAILSQLRS